jgi:hypothetical protein
VSLQNAPGYRCIFFPHLINNNCDYRAHEYNLPIQQIKEVSEMKAYNQALTFEKSTMSDYETSIQLNHKRVDENSLLYSKDGYDLWLCGCITILTPDGQYLFGQLVLDLVDDLKVTKEQVLNWLCGHEAKEFTEYQVLNNPWFEWQDKSGNTVSEVFDSINKSASENTIEHI